MNLWAVGYITGSFGIRGLVKAKPLTDSPERFRRLRRVYRGIGPEAAEEDDLEGIEIRERFILLKFRSTDDRSGADKLKGQYVFVDDADVVSPGKGRYFVHDIIGCSVRTTDGRLIGKVKEVFKGPAQDLWEIEFGKKSYLIPAVPEFIIAVDREKGIITVKVIEGLTDA